MRKRKLIHTNSCTYCGSLLHGQYCSNCGRSSKIKRISLSGLFHEVVHLFTHYDSGFWYTVKRLAAQPGLMQRDFIHGRRADYQKPFSMFFICASVAAIMKYWVFFALINYYELPVAKEAKFINEYLVLLQIVLLPLYTLLAYGFFFRSTYNFAEFGVVLMYTLSFLFLVIAAVSLLKFIWPKMDTAYIELPIWLLYTMITFLNFIPNSKRPSVIIKTIIMIVLQFMLIQFAEDAAIRLLA